MNKSLLVGYILIVTSMPITAAPIAYENACRYCHAFGVGQSPVIHNLDDWASRVYKGKESLLQSVKQGKGAMPAGGLCPECSDEELLEAIIYMSKMQ